MIALITSGCGKCRARPGSREHRSKQRRRRFRSAQVWQPISKKHPRRFGPSVLRIVRISRVDSQHCASHRSAFLSLPPSFSPRSSSLSLSPLLLFPSPLCLLLSSSSLLSLLCLPPICPGWEREMAARCRAAFSVRPRKVSHGLQMQSLWKIPTAAASDKVRHGLQLQSLWRIPTGAAS